MSPRKIISNDRNSNDPSSLINVDPNDRATTTNSIEVAYNVTAEERRALPPDEVMALNLDPFAVTSTVLGAMQAINALRPAAAKLDGFDITHFDRAPKYALALRHCNTLYLMATTGPKALEQRAQEAYDWREKMRAESNTYVLHGVMNEERLKEYSGQKGYRNVSSDLLIQVAAFKEVWPQIESKSFLKRSQLDQIAELASEIDRLVGLREMTPQSVEQSADDRARAFTLLMRSWNQIRRAVNYLRADEGDADSIAPSLFTTRKRRSSSSQEEPEPPEPPVVTPPEAGGTQPGAPVNRALLNSLPGGNPFMD